MLGLFVKKNWSSFYSKGMKTWEIRSYPIQYRGDILVIESGSNKAICKAFLKECIPLTKQHWEMNFEKHRVLCSYEKLPYRQNNAVAYAWVLERFSTIDERVIVPRCSSKPYIQLSDDFVNSYRMHLTNFKAERIACKFIEDTMLLYWMKKNYFALIAIVNLVSGSTQIITSEILPSEVDFIISQLDAL